MIFRRYFDKKRESNDKIERLERCTPEELDDLRQTEKEVYLHYAKHQVRIIGKIDALKDFPIPDTEIVEYIEEEE